jgi:hypothetical protein
MKPIPFAQSNKTLGPPPGMTNEECGSLPIYNDGVYCVSCWQMSWRERLSALFFGKVWLHVMGGHTQPPVAIDVTKTIFKEVEHESVAQQ